MTLGGLLKHLALVEDEYFTRQLTGAPSLSPPFDVGRLRRRPRLGVAYRRRRQPRGADRRCGRLPSRGPVPTSRRRTPRAGRTRRTGTPWPGGEPPALRRLMVDLIEEYARHTGHADLIRESIDGLVGEGAPRLTDLTTTRKETP